MLTQSGLTLDLNVFIAGLYCLGAQWRMPPSANSATRNRPSGTGSPHIRQLPGELLVERPGSAHRTGPSEGTEDQLPRVGIGSGRRGLPLSARAIAIQLPGCPTVRAEGHRVSRRVRGPGRPLCVVHRIDGEQLPNSSPPGRSAQELASRSQSAPMRERLNARRRMERSSWRWLGCRANRLLPAIV